MLEWSHLALNEIAIGYQTFIRYGSWVAGSPSFLCRASIAHWRMSLGRPYGGPGRLLSSVSKVYCRRVYLHHLAGGALRGRPITWASST